MVVIKIESVRPVLKSRFSPHINIGPNTTLCANGRVQSVRVRYTPSCRTTIRGHDNRAYLRLCSSIRVTWRCARSSPINNQILRRMGLFSGGSVLRIVNRPWIIFSGSFLWISG